MKDARRWILFLLGSAVAVHAAVLVAVHVRSGSIDAHAFDSLDAREYYDIARNLVEQGVFSQKTAAPFEPDTWRTPGYPLFLAGLIGLFGDTPAMLVAMQQALGVLNVLLVFVIARHHMSDRRAAIAAALFLLAPYHLYYATWLMATTLFVTILLCCWLLWLRTLGSDRASWYALLGAACGVLVLVRPIGLLVPVVLAVGLVVRRLAREPVRKGVSHDQSAPAERGVGTSATATSTRPEMIGKGGTNGTTRSNVGWLSLAVFVSATLMVVGSWSLRNRSVAGTAALSHQSGVVLAYFKATEVALWHDGRGADRYLETSLDAANADRPHAVWDEIDRRLRERLDHLPPEQRSQLSWRNLAQGNRTTVDSFVVSNALAEIGRSMLLEHPLSTAACCSARCGAILTFPLNLALSPPTGATDNRLAQALKAFPYVALCLAALAGLLRGRWAFDRLYFPLACTLALLAATTPQIDPRFRVPMVPLLIVVALLPGPSARAPRRA